MDSPLQQAFLRAGRTLAAAAISALIVALPQAVGVFALDAAYTTAAIVALTSILNGIGKYIRGPSTDVMPDEPGDKLPI